MSRKITTLMLATAACAALVAALFLTSHHTGSDTARLVAPVPVTSEPL